MSKILKNTILLYGRSIVVLLISLYTSRILLEVLGVKDFGLYNLVGGVVALFASIKVLFAFAVQRFLSYAKGEKDNEKENVVFNVSLFLHAIIAFVFILIVECFGLWFIGNKLNIPEESYSDAYFIFHLSVITSGLAIFGTPYSATVIANEKMNVFAWITIVDAVLKLLIILLLPFIPYYHIRTFAILMLAIEITNFILYYISCRNFPECKITMRYDKKLFKEIASFAGWDFIGNTAWALINEGVNMVLNIFGGVALNAARGIAYQVKNAVVQLVSNVTVASRPHIIKQAAGESREKTYMSIYLMARALFMIMLVTIMPLIVYTEQVLDIWLVKVPEYSIAFVQLVLVWNVVRTMNTPIDLAFTAYGKVKVYQIFNSLALLINLPLSYFFLKMGYPYYYALLSFVIVEIIDIIVNLVVAKTIIDFEIFIYIKKVIIPNTVNIIYAFFVGLMFYFFVIPCNFLSLAFYSCILILALILLMGITLSKDEKAYVFPIINKIIKFKR